MTVFFIHFLPAALLHLLFLSAYCPPVYCYVFDSFMVCWWWQFDWSFACHSSSCNHFSFVIRSSNKIQNGNILVRANPGPPGKWPLKWREMRKRMTHSFEVALLCDLCIYVDCCMMVLSGGSDPGAHGWIQSPSPLCNSCSLVISCPC